MGLASTASAAVSEPTGVSTVLSNQASRHEGTAGGQETASTLLTSAAALYFYHGIALIYQYFCFSNKLMEDHVST